MTSVLTPVRGFAARLALRLVAPLVAAAVLLPSLPASAQGTSGQLPEPMSAQELTRFLDRYVRPTAGQWDGIDPLHEQYKADFKRLRDGEIEAFLESSKKLQGRIPQRGDMERWSKDRDRVFARIKSLDNRLLEQVQGLLEDEQVRAMPRVKLARERATYRDPMMMGIVGGMPTDLSDVLAGLELGRSDFVPLDPTLIPYESQLTRKLADLHESTGTTLVGVVEAVYAAGFGDEDMTKMANDAEKQKAFMEVIQQAFRDATRKGREIAADIAKLNHRTRKALMPLLPPDKVRRFRRDFIARAYPSFGEVDTGVERTLRTALRLKALTEEQRAALRQTLDTWTKDDERLESELIEAMDEASMSRSPFEFGPANSEDPAQKAVERLRERRLEMSTGTIDTAKAIIGPELASKLDQPGGPGQDALVADADSDAAGAAPTSPNQAEMLAQMASEGVGSNGGDMFVAAKIGAPQIAIWSRRLGLDQGQRAILDALHSDYLQQWQSEVEPRIAAIAAASMAAHSPPAKPGDPEPQPAAPSESALDALYAARHAAMQEADKVDRTFIENVRLAVADGDRAPIFDLIALDRELFVAVGSMALAGFDGSRESQVNIAGVVADALDDADLGAAAPIVMGHAEALRNTTQEVRRTTFENQRNIEKLGARMQAAMRDGEGALSASVDFTKEMKPTQEQANAAAQQRREAVRLVLAELKEKLPAEQARKIERGYKRGAFPRAYTDRRSAEPLIERARDLSDLTEQQTKDLAALSEEFQPAYEEVADRMAEHIRDAANPMGGDPEEWQRWQERENKLARLRFERDEVSMKTVRKLRQVLTEEQVNRIPGLAAYAQQERRGPFEGAFGE